MRAHADCFLLVRQSYSKIHVEMLAGIVEVIEPNE